MIDGVSAAQAIKVIEAYTPKYWREPPVSERGSYYTQEDEAVARILKDYGCFMFICRRSWETRKNDTRTVFRIMGRKIRLSEFFEGFGRQFLRRSYPIVNVRGQKNVKDNYLIKPGDIVWEAPPPKEDRRSHGD